MTTDAPPAEAVLLTGGLGSGKTTVAIQLGEILEFAGRPFAVVDLDWLCWAWSPPEHAVQRLRDREAVGSDGGGRLAALLARVAHFEALVATTSPDAPVIDTSDRDPRSVAAEILSHLGWASAGQ